MIYRVVIPIFFLLVIGPAQAIEVRAERNGEAVIYYSEACHGCRDYIDGTLIPLLKEFEIKEISEKEYVNEPQYRKELFELKQGLRIPLELQGHITAVVNRTLFLEGHVPPETIAHLLVRQATDRESLWVIYQDDMRNPTHYRVWTGRGEPKTLSIHTPISEALDELSTSELPKATGAGILLPTVLITGFLDGVNPCAFAVLLFFITFLFTLRRARHRIAIMGSLYILAIFLTYLLIGLGLLKVFSFSQSPHLLAKVGASLVILLGAIQIKDYFSSGLPITLRVPKAGENAIIRWAHKATYPAAFGLGTLVGLCTFPCSGGIYVGVIGLLQTTTRFTEGLSYLLLYNAMFVLPLVLVLMVASSKRVAGKLLHYERAWKDRMHLLYGVTMIGVGGMIFLWLA